MRFLDILIVLLILAWLGGFLTEFGGSLIHLLLVVAVVVFLYRLATGKAV